MTALPVDIPAPAPYPAPVARLLDHLTVEQVAALADELGRIGNGFGDVTLTIERGELTFIRRSESRDVRRRSLRPRPV